MIKKNFTDLHNDILKRSNSLANVRQRVLRLIGNSRALYLNALKKISDVESRYFEVMLIETRYCFLSVILTWFRGNWGICPPYFSPGLIVYLGLIWHTIPLCGIVCVFCFLHFIGVRSIYIYRKLGGLVLKLLINWFLIKGVYTYHCINQQF